MWRSSVLFGLDWIMNCVDLARRSASPIHLGLDPRYAHLIQFSLATIAPIAPASQNICPHPVAANLSSMPSISRHVVSPSLHANPGRCTALACQVPNSSLPFVWSHARAFVLNRLISPMLDQSCVPPSNLAHTNSNAILVVPMIVVGTSGVDSVPLLNNDFIAGSHA